MSSKYKKYILQFCFFCAFYAMVTYTIDHIILSEDVNIKRLIIKSIIISSVYIFSQIAIDHYTHQNTKGKT
jgi:hypothetical protein